MNDYLDERVKKQREWYENKANENKEKFISYQTVIMVLGALIPVIIAFESVFPILKEYGGRITNTISAIIAIYAELDKVNQQQPNWFNYRANEESIKKEEWFYKYKAGPYKKMSEEIKITLKGKDLQKVKKWQELFQDKKPQTTIRRMIRLSSVEERLE